MICAVIGSLSYGTYCSYRVYWTEGIENVLAFTTNGEIKEVL
jgi:hypothetical protein